MSIFEHQDILYHLIQMFDPWTLKTSLAQSTRWINDYCKKWSLGYAQLIKVYQKHNKRGPYFMALYLGYLDAAQVLRDRGVNDYIQSFHKLRKQQQWNSIVWHFNKLSEPDRTRCILTEIQGYAPAAFYLELLNGRDILEFLIRPDDGYKLFASFILMASLKVIKTLIPPTSSIVNHSIKSWITVIFIENRYKTFKYLLSICNITRESQMTLCWILNETCKAGYLDICQILYSKIKWLPDEYFKDGLCDAISGGHLPVVIWLLNLRPIIIDTVIIKCFKEAVIRDNVSIAQYIHSHYKISKKVYSESFNTACYNGYLLMAQWIFTIAPCTINVEHIRTSNHLIIPWLKIIKKEQKATVSHELLIPLEDINRTFLSNATWHMLCQLAQLCTSWNNTIKQNKDYVSMVKFFKYYDRKNALKTAIQKDFLPVVQYLLKPTNSNLIYSLDDIIYPSAYKCLRYIMKILPPKDHLDKYLKLILHILQTSMHELWFNISQDLYTALREHLTVNEIYHEMPSNYYFASLCSANDLLALEKTGVNIDTMLHMIMYARYDVYQLALDRDILPSFREICVTGYVTLAAQLITKSTTILDVTTDFIVLCRNVCTKAKLIFLQWLWNMKKSGMIIIDVHSRGDECFLGICTSNYLLAVEWFWNELQALDELPFGIETLIQNLRNNITDSIVEFLERASGVVSQ